MSSTKTKAAAFARTVASCKATLEALHNAMEVVVAKTAAIPWHAASIVAVGIRTGEVVANPGTTKPSIKLADGKPVPSLFPGMSGHTDFNAGGLFGACLIKANVKAATTATTADAFQGIGKTYGIRTVDELNAAAPNMRRWHVDEAVTHNVTTLKATVREALDVKATDDAAKATAKADAIKAAAKAATDTKAATKTGSVLQAKADGMTRTKAKADMMKWLRDDKAGFRSFITMGADVITESDAIAAKAKAAAETVNATAKAKATTKAA